MTRGSNLDTASDSVRDACAKQQSVFAPDDSDSTMATAVSRGYIVVLSLVNPREKFWGALLGISPSGIFMRGLDIGSFDGAVTMIRDGEQHAPIEVFFPMHRVERMEADTDTSGVPSLQQRFETATGHDPRQFLRCGKRDG